MEPARENLRAVSLTPQASATLYADLRRLAAGFLRRERRGHTLEATALVHEVLLRLGGAGAEHAARVMRQVLVDHARRRRRLKRGGAGRRLTLSLGDVPAAAATPDILDLHEAMQELAAVDPRRARLVELRFFGGMTTAEAADTLGVSLRTAEGDWAFARAWLRRALA